MLVTTLDVASIPPNDQLQTKICYKSNWYIPDFKTCMQTLVRQGCNTESSSCSQDKSNAHIKKRE